MRRVYISMLTIIFSLVFAQSGFAHHSLAGRTPASFFEGFISGIAHPIINVDHLAFVIAIGLITAVGQASKLLPVWFVAGTLVGCVLGYNGFMIPYGIHIVHVALIAIGLSLIFAEKRIPWLDLIAFAITGILHGNVYSTAIFGTVANPFSGYLIGFAVIQIAIATAAMMAAYWLWVGDRLYANARIAGGFIIGVGLTIIAQSAAATLLPML